MEAKERGSPEWRLVWRSLALVLLFQAVGILAAGAVLRYVAGIEMARDFYSAHRSLQSAQNSLLPAMTVAGGVAFLLVALSTWAGFRLCVRRFAAPMQRTDQLLKRLAQGRLGDPSATQADREGWAVESSAAAVTAAFGERAREIQRASKEIQGEVLDLRYKSSGSEPLTLKDLREITARLDDLCKRLSSSAKWFEQ